MTANWSTVRLGEVIAVLISFISNKTGIDYPSNLDGF